MRRRMIVGVMSVLAASALVVGMSATAGVASVHAAKAPVCKGKTKKKAIKQIEKAYDYFLNGTDHPEAADKEEYIQYLSGSNANDELIAQFEASTEANAANAGMTTVEVDSVKCSGKKEADVEFTLVIGGERTEGLAPPGTAVLEDGTWKVSGQTLCDTQALGDPSVLESGPCYDIISGTI